MVLVELRVYSLLPIFGNSVFDISVRWKWAASHHKIFHGHSLSSSMRARNSKAKVSLAGSSEGSNSCIWLISYG
ncbi:hypothetical protein TNCV_4017611 [Trichonephila clavipes]|nr:hypothetical protein TNCV_4017611 [Trichonephila clavipes]